MADSGDKPRWRVFVSHTSELHDFPKGTSYVAAAERAIIATGHIPVDGIQREQVPAEARPVRASKFVNPPPAVAPAWFQGRRAETPRLAGYLSDPGIRLWPCSRPSRPGSPWSCC